MTGAYGVAGLIFWYILKFSISFSISPKKFFIAGAIIGFLITLYNYKKIVNTPSD
jgi:cobalamin synthase